MCSFDKVSEESGEGHEGRRDERVYGEVRGKQRESTSIGFESEGEDEEGFEEKG